MSYRQVTRGDRISGYRVLEKVGQGGFGSVWKAEIVEGEVGFVALKVPRDPLSLDCLRREAQFRLDHPRIVKILGLDAGADPPCLVLEYVEGRNLRRRMLEEGILPPARAIDLALEVCDALSFVHARGILHKDIKPENILLTRSGVKVADFGLARSLEPSASRIVLSAEARPSGVPVLGSVFYMAPEQRTGDRPLDPRADVYSLGVVLFEALTGELPLGMSLPSELNPVVSDDLDAICKRALSLDRDRRYAGAEELRRDLEQARAGYGSVRGRRPVGSNS
jgi:serine/threonine-protein kinase